MANSQNGWPVVGKSACDQGPFQGASFPNGILRGDVATVARWQLKRYAQLVEPVVPGTCWGWFVKEIEGSATISNHASATAWDINATQHPMGTAASHNMSAHEIDMCHQIERESGGVLRWGGDFSRPDPMHWEIVGSRAAVHALAVKINNGQAPGAAPATEDDDVSRVDAKLGVYDALEEAADTTDADPNNGDTPTGRQLRDNFNKLIDARLNVALKPIVAKLDQIIAGQGGAKQ